MIKFRGFKIGRRSGVSRWVIWKARMRNASPCQRLSLSQAEVEKQDKPRKPINKLLMWGRRLTCRARSLCFPKPGSGYVPLGSEPEQEKPSPVPKGHLAVYVGQEDGEYRRVLMPVIYFNHPLFGELLREAEKEYGFQQVGGITIPCRFAEFEEVKTRIASGSGSGKRRFLWQK